MFGLGWAEMGVVAIAALLLFGSKRIPELGGAMGKTMRNFKEGLKSSPEDAKQELVEQGSGGAGEQGR